MYTHQPHSGGRFSVVVVVVVVFISNCILLLFTYISDYISLHIIYNLWYVH